MAVLVPVCAATAIGTIGSGTTGAEETAWTQVVSGTTARLTAVEAISADEAWVIGAAGSILHCDARRCETYEAVTPNPYNGIGLDGNEGYIVGDRGVILAYSGSGSWSRVSSPTTADLKNVAHIGPDWWAVGAGGVVLRRDGDAWRAEPTFTDEFLNGITFAEDGRGWIVGDAIYVSNGREWIESSGPQSVSYSDADASSSGAWLTAVNSMLYGLLLYDDGDVVETVYEGHNQLYGVAMQRTGETGFAVGAEVELSAVGVVLRIDGGRVENRLRVEKPLYGVDVVGSAAWAVGDQGLVMRYGAGIIPRWQLYVPFASK